MLDIVILGLSVTSSWGNGHATTWRSLIKGLAARGHNILFLERDTPWYSENRDAPQPQGATTILYHSLEQLFVRFEEAVSRADLVIVGSYVPDGVEVGEWVVSIARGRTAFYDIDTPITMSLLESGRADYLSRELVRDYDCYLSFMGGPTLKKLEAHYGSRMARTFYCSVDTDKYVPLNVPTKWNLGYLGTYSDDRQPALQSLLIDPAQRALSDQFVVAGPQYPDTIRWPANVCRIQHLPPGEHPAFYSSQQFTLNITREAMRLAGHSPSVRLFEAAACGVPLISDWWEGLDTLFIPGKEILIARDGEDVDRFLREFTETDRLQLAHAARNRVLQEHTSIARAQQLEGYVREMNDHFSAHPARGYRCAGASVGGLDTGVEFERSGATAGEGTF